MTILADAETRLLVQGITGREAATFTLESLRYGARIVAGVTPGKAGQQIHGVPVFNTVAQALQAQPCQATIISVPAPYVREAAREALEHGLKLLVIVTERLPRRDAVAVLEQATGCGARVIGPNSLGLISPHLTRIGMCGGASDAVRKAYRPGAVGVVSRSGGMMTEIANMLTQNQIGQSTCVSVGGDAIVGTTIMDLLPLYEADPSTRAVVYFCEPGGTVEERLAEHLRARPSRLPIIAFVAGRFADRIQGVRFGHAGSMVEGMRGSPAGKMAALREAGVYVAEKLSHIPMLVKEALGDKPATLA